MVWQSVQLQIAARLGLVSYGAAMAAAVDLHRLALPRRTGYAPSGAV
jgi:hypothetical protein